MPGALKNRSPDKSFGSNNRELQFPSNTVVDHTQCGCKRDINKTINEASLFIMINANNNPELLDIELLTDLQLYE